MDVVQLKELIIEPTLEKLNLYSDSAVNLLLGTAAVESQCGRYIHQIKGPAQGIYQVEPATHHDILNNFVKYRQELSSVLKSLTFPWDHKHNMIGNLFYATAIARIHYLRVPEALPKSDNIEALGIYWKAAYNTIKGKGTVNGFIDAWNTYIGGNI